MLFCFFRGIIAKGGEFMKNYPIMNKTLSSLLNEGEIIKHPICAVLEYDGRRYFSYFAFTNDALLIALTHENNTNWSKRIPLDITSLNIKEYNFFSKREYEINIAFKDNSPIKIIIPYKNFTYGEQKEDTRQFIDYLKEHSPQNSYPSLKDVSGIKLRRQYFNFPIYLLSPVIPISILVITMVLIKNNEFAFKHWLALSLEGVCIVLALLSPFIVLSILNRFLFGNIVSVINNQGIYLENNFIPWDKIHKITYIPNTPSRYQHSVLHHRYTRLNLTLTGETGEGYDVEIKNFPFYGIFKLKKFCPDKKIKFAAKFILCEIIILIIAMLISLLIPFV